LISRAFACKNDNLLLASKEKYIEEEILPLVSKGSQAAFERLIDHYSPVLYPYLLAWLKNVPKAEEVLQDIFMSVWTHRHKLATMNNFSGYLYVTARNFSISALRQELAKKRRNPLYHIGDTTQTPETTLESKELGELLQKGIESLSSRRKDIFQMSREQGMTYEAIAQRLGISKETVKDHIAGALVYLRYYLREHGGIDLLIVLFAAFFC